MPTDEEIWNVGVGRAGGLSLLNTGIKGAAGAVGGVLFYPGALTDILNPLFSTYSLVTAFVLVDIQTDLVVSLENMIKSTPTRLDADGLRDKRQALEIAGNVKAGWKFKFKGLERIVILVEGSYTAFLADNPRFRYDVLFDKDFWETSEQYPLNLVFSRLERQGFFATDNSAGGTPILEACGFQFVARATLNSEFYIWQKTRPTPADVEAVFRAFKVTARDAMTEVFMDTSQFTIDTRANGWTNNNWIDAMALALVDGRTALGAHAGAMAAARIWEALETIVIQVLERGWDVASARASLQAAEARAGQVWGNALAITQLRQAVDLLRV